MPVLPPWIKAADPAAHMAQGMHIGIQIGAQQAEERMRQQAAAAKQAQFQQEMDAQQAAQRFKEVQAAKQEQMAARDQALSESKFGLAASEAARKHQAMQEYQSAVTGGMDPNEAMLRWGPSMAANTGAAAAIRAHERESRAPIVPQEITLPSGLRGVQMGQQFKYEPSARSGAIAKVPEGAKHVPATADVPEHWALPAKDKSELTAYQNTMERDRTEKALEKLRDAQPSWSEDEPPAKANKVTAARWKTWKGQIDGLQKRIEGIESPAAKSGRVRVKSPDGKTGSIPADQLDDALAHGYTQVQ